MPGADTARALIARSRHTSTQAQYGRLFSAFCEYCEEAGVPALPATQWTVVNYIGRIAEGGRWAADSLQPILSAINAAHRDMLLEPPACDNHFLTLVRRGMRRAQVEAGGTRDSRIPLPCEHLLAILSRGEGARVHLRDGVEQLRAVRASLGISLTSLFAGRQDSGVHLRTRDFGADDRFIWLRLTEKGKKGHVVRRILHLDLAAAGAASALPRVAALGRYYLDLRRSLLRDGQAEPEFLLQLQGEPRPTTRHMEQWFAAELAAAGVQAPPGFAYLGHSIRSMAASAMAAIGVPRHVYIFVGGWARGSTVVDKHYIDPTFRPSPAAHALYGWLLASAFSADAGTVEAGVPLPDPWLATEA